MPEAPLSVFELADVRLPWSVRRRVRRLKRRGRAGIVLAAVMASGRRRMSSLDPTVSLSGNSIRLSLSSVYVRRSDEVRCAAGSYQLTLRVARSRLRSSFDYGIELADGDVFVAVCRPIQPWTLFGSNPESDEWYLGVV